MIDVTKIEMNPIPDSIVTMKKQINVLNEENISLNIFVLMLFITATAIISYQAYQNKKKQIIKT